MVRKKGVERKMKNGDGFLRKTFKELSSYTLKKEGDLR